MNILIKAFLAELLVCVLAASALWPEAWLFLCLFFGFVTFLAIFLSRRSPDLLDYEKAALSQDDR